MGTFLYFAFIFYFRYHTLVLQENNKIYSFGCNDQNQLGRSNDSHPSVPLPVLLPQGKVKLDGIGKMTED